MVGLFYKLLAWIDYLVYSLAKTMIDVNLDIAGKEIFLPGQITTIANRIYIVVGVLMLFKVVISAIQFMVNPDAFDDKEKGAVGLLKKTAICLGMIVIAPAIFNFMVEMQSTIVETIPNIVFSTDTDKNEAKDKAAGMTFTVLSSFISESTEGPNAGKGKVCDDASCDIHDLDSFKDHAADGCGGGIWGDAKNCYYKYMIIVSTLSGGFLCYVLMSMTLDVAIRTIKFSIIRILAPIPISSYIFGKEKLNKFIKTTLTVYCDLFIRLAVIYFIIFAVEQVVASNLLGEIVGKKGWFYNAIVNVAIIGGLFMFAKNAPKFITELLGLPDVGAGDMKDMFKPAWQRAGVFGAASAGLRTAASNYVAQKERMQGKGKGAVASRLRGLASAAAGFGSAAGRGTLMAAQGKGYKDVKQGANKAAIAARNRRADRVDKLYNKEKYIDAVDENGNYILDANGNRQKVKNPEYYGWKDYRRDVMREQLGIPSGEGFKKTRYDAMEAIAKDAASAKSHGATKMNETPNKYKVTFRTKNGSFANADYATINAALGYEELTMEQARNMYKMAQNGQRIEDVHGNATQLTAAQIDALGSLVQTVEKRTSYLKEAELMATGDPAASPNVDKLVLGLASNKDMFNDKAIIEPIIGKMEKDLGNYRLSDDKTSADYHKIKIGDQVYDMTSADTFKFNDLLEITKQLKVQLRAPKLEDQKYQAMRAAGRSDADINSALAADVAAFNATYDDKIIMRADILTGIKDAFEEVTKTQYREAQIADNKAKKAQQAISNNNDKKG